MADLAHGRYLLSLAIVVLLCPDVANCAAATVRVRPINQAGAPCLSDAARTLQRLLEGAVDSGYQLTDAGLDPAAGHPLVAGTDEGLDALANHLNRQVESCKKEFLAAGPNGLFRRDRDESWQQYVGRWLRSKLLHREDGAKLAAGDSVFVLSIVAAPAPAQPVVPQREPLLPPPGASTASFQPGLLEVWTALASIFALALAGWIVHKLRQLDAAVGYLIENVARRGNDGEGWAAGKRFEPSGRDHAAGGSGRAGGTQGRHSGDLRGGAWQEAREGNSAPDFADATPPRSASTLEPYTPWIPARKKSLSEAMTAYADSVRSSEAVEPFIDAYSVRFADRNPNEPGTLRVLAQQDVKTRKEVPYWLVEASSNCGPSGHYLFFSKLYYDYKRTSLIGPHIEEFFSPFFRIRFDNSLDRNFRTESPATVSIDGQTVRCLEPGMMVFPEGG